MSTDKPIIVKGNSFKTDFKKLAYNDEIPSIEKTGVKRIAEFNQLMLKINQHPNVGNSHINREWVAKKLNVKVGDLNEALKPDSPSGSHSNLLNNSIKFLEKYYKSLDIKKN